MGSGGANAGGAAGAGSPSGATINSFLADNLSGVGNRELIRLSNAHANAANSVADRLRAQGIRFNAATTFEGTGRNARAVTNITYTVPGTGASRTVTVRTGALSRANVQNRGAATPSFASSFGLRGSGATQFNAREFIRELVRSTP